MYSPPSKLSWHYVGLYDELYDTYYNMGWNDAKAGKNYEEPYRPSGHERETTHTDELNYWHWKGYEDYGESAP